jgi:hypothetical protein
VQQDQHATKINPDLVIPNKATNPDEKGSHVRPLLYLYGEKNGKEWRAVLNLIHFVNWGQTPSRTGPVTGDS